MANPVPPSSGDARVCAAVTLGWEVAQLFHSPVHTGPVENPGRTDRLPGRSDFSAATQSKWLAEQIGATAADLLVSEPQEVRDAHRALLVNLDKTERDRNATLDSIFQLHCQLLEALTVADFRLGEAYGLGRALAETALVPAGAADDEAESQFRELLGAGRVGTIKDWLIELKTMLPDHAAYAVSSALDDWSRWVGEQAASADWKSAKTAMRSQGYIWRELISGEKAAQDTLSVAGYLAAARQIARRAIRQTWWIITITLLAAVGVVLTMVFLTGIPPTARLLAALAWVGATFGAALKAFGSLLGTAARGAEGWLWQTELDESVATAATTMPPPARHHRVTGSSVGQMSRSAGLMARLGRATGTPGAT
jgi:hypothetical protein